MYVCEVSNNNMSACDTKVPQVLEDIQAVPVLNDAQSISLQCQFGTLTASSTVTWTKGGTMLSKNQKG